ncbi:condensation domain-containing protein [Streptomyces sp. NPDC001351]|uniref:condensation domain-containing protein n=1 Tax=Streptomyces sp. NPDC001351 TaxID=3364564 RepID=UPI0036A12F9B
MTRLNWPQLDWHAGWRIGQHPALARTDPHEYNMATAAAMPVDTTARHAHAAVTELVTRHPSLRTRFTEDATQQVLPVTATDVDRITVVAPEDEAEGVFRRWLRTDFALADGWAVRVVLGCAGGTVRSVGVVADHLVVDGWGVRVLCDDLVGLLSGVRLAADVAQPRDVVAWEDSPAGRRHHSAALAGWRAHLTELRDNSPGPAIAEVPAFSACFAESTALGRDAEAAAAVHGVPVSLVFAAAYGSALCDLTGESVAGLQAHVTNRHSAAQRRSAACLFLRAPLLVRRDDPPTALVSRWLRGAVTANADRLRVERLRRELLPADPNPVTTAAWFNYQERLTPTEPPPLLPTPLSAPPDGAIHPDRARRRGRPFVLKVYRYHDRALLHLLWQDGIATQALAHDVLHALTDRVSHLAAAAASPTGG